MSGPGPSSRPRFNVSANDIGAGISRDIAILRSALAPVGELHVSPHDEFAFGDWMLALLAQQLLHRPSFAATIFLETIKPRWVGCSPANWFIPNPEWLPSEQLGLVRQMDWVICKTRDAVGIFRELGISAEYVGFTSEDRWNGSPLWELPLDRALHVAGRSYQKGTATLLNVWLRHPEWPELVVVQRPAFPDDILSIPQAGNIRWISTRISDAELRTLQNSAPIHILPSEAEGFGHSLVESLSCGAVLVTTDGPPMNETVNPDRGILVRPWKTGKKLFGNLALVDPVALEQACGAAFRLSRTERESLGRQARKWYLENDAGFRERILAAVAARLAQRPS